MLLMSVIYVALLAALNITGSPRVLPFINEKIPMSILSLATTTALVLIFYYKKPWRTVLDPYFYPLIWPIIFLTVALVMYPVEGWTYDDDENDTYTSILTDVVYYSSLALVLSRFINKK